MLPEQGIYSNSVLDGWLRKIGWFVVGEGRFGMP